MDAQPRTLTVQDVNMLCNFAELVVREVEKKHVVRATLSPSNSVAQHMFYPEVRYMWAVVRHACHCLDPVMSLQASIRPAA